MSAAVDVFLVERVEDRRLLTAVVAPADPVVWGDAVTGPLPPSAGRSVYVSGARSNGAPVSQWASASAITPNTTNDLVLNVTPFSTNYHACCEGTGASAALLTNGITQTQIAPGSGNQPATGDGGASDPSNNTNIVSDLAAPYFLSYNLDTAGANAVSPNGYDLNEIDLITGHQDGRVAISLIDVLVEPVGSTHFVSLSGGQGFSLTNIGSTAIKSGAAQMAIVDGVAGQPLARNIQAVQLSVLNPQTFFREFVVTGAASASTPAVTGAPTGVGVTYSSVTGNTVTWTPPASGATGYTVLRSTSAAGPYGPVGSVAGRTTFIDSNVQPATTYFYQIIASGNGDSAPSSPPASITTPNFGTQAVVAAPDPITYGDAVSGPLATRPGHSFYVSGNTFNGAAVSTWANASAITPNTVNDLVLNVAPYASDYVGIAEGINAFPGNTSSAAQLFTNGLTQNQIGNFPSLGAVPAIGSNSASDASSGANTISEVAQPWSMAYNLGAAPGATPDANGYDLTEIDVITGHQDVRTGMPLLDVMIRPVGSSQFYSLSNGHGFTLLTVPDGSGGTVTIARGGAQMAIVSSVAGSPLATNVAAVKFVEMASVANNASFFRELVVTGAASAAVPPPTAPPTGVTASLNPLPTINWNAPTGATGYTVERATSAGGPFVPIGSVLNQTTFTDNSVAPATTYYYEVLATGNGDSALSAPSNPITTANFGALAYFYSNASWLGTPVISGEQVPQINYNGPAASAGTGNVFPTPFPIGPGVPASFSTLVQGRVTTDRAGVYTFGANTDDDGYLFVNGQLVSTNIGQHAQQLASVTIPITLGANTAYDFIFLHDNRGGGAWGFQMYWQEPTAAGTAGPVVPVPGIQMQPVVTPATAPASVTPAALSDVAVQVSWAPTQDTSSYGYVLQRAQADGNGNPVLPYTTITTAFSGPTSGGPAANRWGVTSIVDSTAAPNTTYVYRVGVLMPGQSTPVSFSADSAPVTTSPQITPTLSPGGTLNIALAPYQTCTLAAGSGGTTVVVTEGGQSTTFAASLVNSINVTGVTGAPVTFNVVGGSGTLNLAGALSVNQVTNVTMGAPITAGQVQVSASGNVIVNSAVTTTGPASPAGAPQVDLRANGNLTLNASVNATGPVKLVADADGDLVGTLTIAAASTVSSGGNAITTHFGTLTVNGTVNAGAGDVTYEGTGNSFTATGFAAHTISSGTVTLTSGAVSISRADVWSAGTTGTVFYNFPLGTTSFSTTGINTSAGNANLKISVPFLINVTGPLNTGSGSVTLSAANVNISNNAAVTTPGVNDAAGTITIPANQQMTFVGPMTLTANVVVAGGGIMHVTGGMTLDGSVTLNGGSVSFDGSQTLGGSGQIRFGTGTGNLWVTNGTLTIGAGITVSGVAGATGTANITRHDALQDAIVNMGVIDANRPGQTFNLSFFSNQGTVRATGGGAVSVTGITGNLGAGYSASGAGSRLTLSGQPFTIDAGISASAGASIQLLGNWTNASTITLDKSSLNLGGAFLTDGLGTITSVASPSTVNVTGFLDNRPGSNPFSSGTLSLPASAGAWNLATGGTIMGGAVTGAPLGATGGTLNGVTLGTALSLQNASVTVLNGLTLANSTVVTLFSTASAPSTLIFGNSESLAGQGFVIFNGDVPATPGYLAVGRNGIPANLTIDQVVILTGSGSGVIGSGLAGNSVVNNGQIVTGGQQTITILDPLSGTGTTTGALHQTDYWTGAAGDNNWSTAANWSTNAVPTANDAVVINAPNPGASTITIDSGAQSVYSLVSSWPIQLAAGTESLAVATTSQFSANLTLHGGTLFGGTYSTSGGAIISMDQSPTLDGVALNAGFTIGTGATLHVKHGLTLGTTITIAGGTLSFDGTQTLAGTGRIALGGTVGGDALYINAAGAAGGTLTVAPGVTVSSATGSSGAVTIGRNDSSPDAIVNQGTFTFNLAAQPVTLSGVGFTNQGSLTVTNTTLNLAAASGAWANQGAMTLSNATLNDATDTLTNTGTISGNGLIRLASLVNSNLVTFSGGNTQVFGPVTNNGNLQVTKVLATFNGFVNDAGTIKTTGATARFLGGASVSGTYVSDPSNNYFADLEVTGNGVLSAGVADPGTGARDLFVVTGGLTNTSTNANAADTAGAQLQFQGATSHQVVGSFSFATVTVDAGNAVTLAPAPDNVPTTFTAVSVVNNGQLQVQAPFVATGTVTNNAGSSLTVEAPFEAPMVTVATGAALAVNTSAFTTAAVDNRGTVEVNAPAAVVPLSPTSTGTVTYGTTTSVSAAAGTYGDAGFLLSAHVTAANGATVTSGAVTFVVFDSGNTQVGPVVVVPVDPTGNAAATFTVPGLAAGSYTVSAAYHDPASDAALKDSDGASTLTIARAALVVTAGNASRTYGQANPPFTGTIGATKNGDAFTAVYATAATSASDAGTYAITASLNDPFNKLANYNVTFQPGTLTVKPAGLLVTAKPATKIYGTADPAFGLSFAGFVNGDTAGLLSGTAAFTTSEPATGNAPVGSYTITPSGLTSSNYTLTFAPGTLSVMPAGLMITANPASKVYGSPDPAFSVGYSGFATGDTAASLAGTLSFVTGEPAGSAPVGTYSITPSGVSSPNYSIVFVPGTLSVTPDGTRISVASSSGGSSGVGQAVTFTATVAPAAPGTQTPVGQVRFFDNGVLLGAPVSLAGGKASFTASALAIGSHNITAEYLPSPNFLPSSTTSPLVQTIGAGVLLLDATGSGALTVSGNGAATVTGAGGAIVVDSSSASAVIVSGSGAVSAGLIEVDGNVVRSGNGKLAGTVETGDSPVADPLAGLAAPSAAGMTTRSTSRLLISTGAVTLRPGVYTGGIQIGGDANVTLEPGIYYIQGGGLSVSGAAMLTDLGRGVLIYNAAASSSDGISVSDTARVSLSAMTSGAYQGLTLFQSRGSTAPIALSGNARLSIAGAVYAARAAVQITGNAVFAQAGQSSDLIGFDLIAYDLLVTGSGKYTLTV